MHEAGAGAPFQVMLLAQGPGCSGSSRGSRSQIQRRFLELRSEPEAKYAQLHEMISKNVEVEWKRGFPFLLQCLAFSLAREHRCVENFCPKMLLVSKWLLDSYLVFLFSLVSRQARLICFRGKGSSKQYTLVVHHLLLISCDFASSSFAFVLSLPQKRTVHHSLLRMCECVSVLLPPITLVSPTRLLAKGPGSSFM